MKENDRNIRPTPPMLINQISRMFDERMRERLPSGHPMTQNSCRFIMRTLIRGDGVTQQELVKETNMKAPTISVALKGLEDEGIIVRKNDENDMRSVRVYLTDYGRKFDDDFRNQIRTLDQTLMDGITKEEEDVLIDLLLRVKENVGRKIGKEKEKN